MAVWDAFGSLLVALGSFLGALGPILAALWGSWVACEALGSLLGALREISRRSWIALGGSGSGQTRIPTAHGDFKSDLEAKGVPRKAQDHLHKAKIMCIMARGQRHTRAAGSLLSHLLRKLTEVKLIDDIIFRKFFICCFT